MKQAHQTFKTIIIVLILMVLLGGQVFTGRVNAIAGGTHRSMIVTGKNLAVVKQQIAAVGGQITSELDIIHAAAALIPTNRIEKLAAAPGILAVVPNASTQLSDVDVREPLAKKKVPATDYPDITGADLLWQEGNVGQGVTVAVLDTGIALHPSLGKDLNGKPRFPLGWVDFIGKLKKPNDPNGHGTHIAGIIANAEIGSDQEYDGMAPGVDLVGVRVLDETGAGTYESVINGIQWVIQHREQYNIKVINLSLHAVVQSPYWADPLNQAVMRAWAEGITVVVAAGNTGPGPMTINVPGNVPYVITVGAFTDHYTPGDWSDDYITPFSAAGPTLDNFVKPDVVAPGGHIVSTMQNKSYVAKNHNANQVDPNYFSMAGTSQSSAVVSGITALVLSRNPNLTPDQVKYRIMATALPWITEDGTQALYSIWQQGYGRVNAYDAVMQDEMTGSANQGLDVWADLNGDTHYQGFSYFDSETGMFRLMGDFDDPTAGAIGAWSGAIGAWSGAIGAWSGSHYGAWGDAIGAWSGAIGAWSGAIGAWSGAIGAWSGAIGAWSGAIGAWSGAIGAWSGGYTSYADAIGAWSGAIGAWSGAIGAWSGGVGNWTSSDGAWTGTNDAWSGAIGAWSGSTFIDPNYIATYTSSVSPGTGTTLTSVTDWIEEARP